MILIDSIGHMVATESEEEFHQFAKKIGLKREWFQQPNEDSKRRSHYDLTTKRKISWALEMGAKQVAIKEILIKAWWAKEED